MADSTMPIVRVRPATDKWADEVEATEGRPVRRTIEPGDEFLYLVEVGDQERYARTPWEAIEIARTLLSA